MNAAAPTCLPYDSAHHKDTTPGDTFGGLGTDREYREEETRAEVDFAGFQRGFYSGAEWTRKHDQIGRRAFYDLAPRGESYP